MTQPTDFIEQLAALAEKATQELPIAKLDEVAASAVDWDGTPMADNEPAKWETEAGTIRAMVAEICVMRGLMPAILALGRENAALRETGAFLIARLDDLDWSLSFDDFCREHAGHVDPAISRFRAALEGDNQ